MFYIWVQTVQTEVLWASVCVGIRTLLRSRDDSGHVLLDNRLLLLLLASVHPSPHDLWPLWFGVISCGPHKGNPSLLICARDQGNKLMQRVWGGPPAGLQWTRTGFRWQLTKDDVSVRLFLFPHIQRLFFIPVFCSSSSPMMGCFICEVLLQNHSLPLEHRQHLDVTSRSSWVSSLLVGTFRRSSRTSFL